jgi:hypothetical protein
VRGHAQALGCVAALENLEVTARTWSDASVLRKRRTERGSAHGMVGAAMELFREGYAR